MVCRVTPASRARPSNVKFRKPCDSSILRAALNTSPRLRSDDSFRFPKEYGRLHRTFPFVTFAILASCNLILHIVKLNSRQRIPNPEGSRAMDKALQPATAQATHRFPRWLRVGFWLCIAIAIAVVIRRLVALGYPSHSGPPQMVQLDAYFASHAALTLVHILPALLFVLAVPFYYTRWSAASRWIERTLFLLGAVVGVTAYAMSTHAVGGWIERSAVFFFNSFFLYSLGCS